jgi:hypothetical protein
MILFALADNNDTVHCDGADQRSHGVDSGPIAAILVATTNPAGSSHRSGLGDADEFQGEVPVGCLAFDGELSWN